MVKETTFNALRAVFENFDCAKEEGYFESLDEFNVMHKSDVKTLYLVMQKAVEALESEMF